MAFEKFGHPLHVLLGSAGLGSVDPFLSLSDSLLPHGNLLLLPFVSFYLLFEMLDPFLVMDVEEICNSFLVHSSIDATMDHDHLHLGVHDAHLIGSHGDARWPSKCSSIHIYLDMVVLTMNIRLNALL